MPCICETSARIQGSFVPLKPRQAVCGGARGATKLREARRSVWKLQRAGARHTGANATGCVVRVEIVFLPSCWRAAAAGGLVGPGRVLCVQFLFLPCA